VIQVKREFNGAAHELSQLARRTVNSAVWLGRAPAACVSDLVTNDCKPSS
jgi:hypothetical protein